MGGHKHKGLTLVEVILYIAILSIVVVSLTRYTLAIASDRTRVTAEFEVEGNARALSETFSYYVRSADAVSVPLSGATTTTLLLDMPGATPDITVLIENGLVQFGESGVGTSTITSDEVLVSDISFYRASLPGRRESIRIGYTITFDSDTNIDYARSYSTAITRRR